MSLRASILPALLVLALSTIQAAADGCPPGLAKKHNGCMPPGLAKKDGHRDHREYREREFVYIDDWRRYGLDAPSYGRRYAISGNQIVEVDPVTFAVLRIIRALN